MLSVWGISRPHEFQVRAVHDIAFVKDKIFYIIAKTGSGKSAIPLTVGCMLSGVSLTMVPLVGLGSDQVSKSFNEDHFVESYHLDEMRGPCGRALRQRLESLHSAEAECVSIFLYASPKSLLDDSPWFRCLQSLSLRGFLCLICIDEAHTVAQDGRSFRPEFRTAIKSLQ
jgi:superfamily II DNA helicase RecQ